MPTWLGRLCSLPPTHVVMSASDPTPLTFFVLDVETVEAGKVKGKGTAGAAKGKAPPSDATDSVVMWGRARAGQPVCAVVPSSAFTSFFFFKAPDFVVVGDDDGDGDGGSSSGGNRRPFDPVRVRVRARVGPPTLGRNGSVSLHALLWHCAVTPPSTAVTTSFK